MVSWFWLGPEYGTTEAAWKGVLGEADRLCDLHLKVRDNLCNDVMQQVKTWQKDTYHKVERLSYLLTQCILIFFFISE
jgi:hypothetical protein